MEKHETATAGNAISGITRRKLTDCVLAMDGKWSGGLTDVEFLSRLFNLSELPSTDYRREDAAGDIWQHRENNDDWEDDWVFKDDRFLMGCSDEVFLSFIAETLHPEVRVDISDEPPRLLEEFNAILAPDGYKLLPRSYVSGHAIYGWVQTSGFQDVSAMSRLVSKSTVLEKSVLGQHLKRIEGGLTRDPAMAISSCKELLESLFKLILEQGGVAYSETADDFPTLYKKVAKFLELDKSSVEKSKKGSEASYKVLGSLSGAVQGIAELRNAIGLGHGKAVPAIALERHARLTFNSTVALAEFIVDTRDFRVQVGRISRK